MDRLTHKVRNAVYTMIPDGVLDSRTVVNLALGLVALLSAMLIATIPSGQTLLQIEIQSTEAEKLQVFFDQGSGFSEALSITRAYSAGTQTLDFPVPPGNSNRVRIDPAPHTHQLVLLRARVLDGDGRVASSLPLGNLVAQHEVSDVERVDAQAVRLSMPDGAADPQALLPLEHALSSSAQAAFWHGILWQMFLASVLILAIRTVAVLPLPATHLCVAALALVAVMAMLSPFDPSPHPDEFLHVADAGYFRNHLLPPALASGELSASYTNNVYGVSYLYEWNVVYWFSGKFGQLLSSMSVDPAMAYRLFNVLLLGFVATVILAARMPRSALAILFVTPQLWYVFSYFNGDAFPFALGCAVVALAAARNGALQRFIVDGGPLRWQVVLFVIALGLLFISKRNYLPVALFAGLWLCCTCLRLNASATVGVVGIVAVGVFMATADTALQADFGLRWTVLAILSVVAGGFYVSRWFYTTFVRIPEHRAALGRLIALHVFAVVIAAPWIGLDIHQNGIGQPKADLVTGIIEHNAAHPFKPSTIAMAPEESQPGLRLAEKGVSLRDTITPPYDWARGSYRSFFSAYGYMKYYGAGWMYAAFGWLMVCLVGLGTIAGLRNGELGARHVVLSVGFVSIIVGAAALHSWTYDFQPQGRYVLGVLPILMPLLAGIKSSGRLSVIFSVVATTAFAISAYSFVMIGLASLV